MEIEVRRYHWHFIDSYVMLDEQNCQSSDDSTCGLSLRVLCNWHTRAWDTRALDTRAWGVAWLSADQPFAQIPSPYTYPLQRLSLI